MKIEIPLLAVMLFMSTTLLTRMAVQGIELALVSTAIEWWLSGSRTGVKLFRKHFVRLTPPGTGECGKCA